MCSYMCCQEILYLSYSNNDNILLILAEIVTKIDETSDAAQAESNFIKKRETHVKNTYFIYRSKFVITSKPFKTL